MSEELKEKYVVEYGLLLENGTWYSELKEIPYYAILHYSNVIRQEAEFIQYAWDNFGSLFEYRKIMAWAVLNHRKI